MHTLMRILTRSIVSADNGLMSPSSTVSIRPSPAAGARARLVERASERVLAFLANACARKAEGGRGAGDGEGALADMGEGEVKKLPMAVYGISGSSGTRSGVGERYSS